MHNIERSNCNLLLLFKSTVVLELQDWWWCAINIQILLILVNIAVIYYLLEINLLYNEKWKVSII